MTTDDVGDDEVDGHVKNHSPLIPTPLPIVPKDWIPFKLEQPSAATLKSLEEQNIIHESASRLLFLTVHWVRSLPAFQVLPLEIQTFILRDTWSELFCLGFVHREKNGDLLNCQNVVIDKDAVGIPKLEGFLQDALNLWLDDHELAFLKVLVLFSQDRVSNFGEEVISSFEEIKALAVEEMVEYVKGKMEEGAAAVDVGMRIANALLLLPQLR